MKQTVIERALTLAGSGGFANFSELRRYLQKEQYLDVRAHLDGHFIRTQLCALIEATKRGDLHTPPLQPSQANASLRRHGKQRRG